MGRESMAPHTPCWIHAVNVHALEPTHERMLQKDGVPIPPILLLDVTISCRPTLEAHPITSQFRKRVRNSPLSSSCTSSSVVSKPRKLWISHLLKVAIIFPTAYASVRQPFFPRPASPTLPKPCSWRVLKSSPDLLAAFSNSCQDHGEKQTEPNA